jgi:hypothetical protein
MNRMLIAIAALMFFLPAFSTQVQAHETPGSMRQMMLQHPEMKKEMMANPQHMLMMAYHRNMMTFSHQLMKVARQGETVPREFARTAIAEMRRSTEEMERYRAEAMRNVPADVKEHGDMQKMMDQHLVDVKTHLRELENLARADRIPSQDVIKQLDAMIEGCEGMDCGMMHGKGMHGMHGKGMHGAHHGCEECVGSEGCTGCGGCPCGGCAQE